jgi:hypothetical protein
VFRTALVGVVLALLMKGMHTARIKVCPRYTLHE